jgi:hypothetical protein
MGAARSDSAAAGSAFNPRSLVSPKVRLISSAPAQQALLTHSIDLKDFHGRTGNRLPDSAWSLLPSSVYVGMSEATSSYLNAGQSFADKTIGAHAGASWGWQNGNTDISYWNYKLNSRDGSYDSSGHGLTASAGFYNGFSGLSFGVSYSRLDDLAPASRAVNSGADFYSVLTYKPYNFSDIALIGNIGEYKYHGIAYGNTDIMNYWSAAIVYDVSKFIQSSFGPSRKDAQSAGLGDMLKFLYRYSSKNTNPQDTGTDNHYVGIAFRKSPGDIAKADSKKCFQSKEGSKPPRIDFRGICCLGIIGL